MANKFRAEPSFQLFENAIRLASVPGTHNLFLFWGAGEDSPENQQILP